MLLEKVKNFLKIQSSEEKEPDVPEDKILNNFETDAYTTGAFMDDEYTTIFNQRDKASQLEAQKNKIMLYRHISKLEEVSDAIDEICNEITYSETKDIIKVQVNEENEKIQDAIQKAFGKICKLINIQKNLYNIVRQSYIDGQVIFHCKYNKTLSDGIEKIQMVEPIYLYFDKKSQKYKYYQKDKSFVKQREDIKTLTYEKEEIIRETFGLSEGNIITGYLEYVIKSANQLKVLEDLLIPLRFSRSISRRIFNVDTGELSNSKSVQAMQDIQKKFKYKKFYNTETGEITNQQHITSMVEDYWFANRSGAKGTQVDVLDETGNLGEINDILYFQKKVYKALKIPSNRISTNTDNQEDFDYDTTSISREDIKFFMFINRLRKVYLEVFNELLKRELISTNIMTAEDYNEYKDKIEIIFTNEVLFIERMKLNNFSNKLDIYATAQEYAGKLMPVQTILKIIFKWTDEEIDENFKLIEKESTDDRFKSFYQEEDDGY